MSTRLLTLGVWMLVAASALFWGLKVAVPRAALPSQAQLPARHLALGGELRHLLGTSEVVAGDDEEDTDTGDDRFHLLGVVAPRGAGTSPQGVALIAVGDQPARPWRTGAVVDGDTVLLSVDRRSVQLGPRGGPATTELTLPEPTPNVAGQGVAHVNNAPPAQGFRPPAGVPGVNQLRPPGMPAMGLQPLQQQVQPKAVNPGNPADTTSDDEEE
jgi:general secretion pathway protein C